MPGALSVSIDRLTDVNLGTKSDNDVLQFNSTTGVWSNSAVTAAISVDDLTDVTITGTPADNELLSYDTGTSEWINQTSSEAGLQPLDADLTALAALGATVGVMARTGAGAFGVVTLTGTSNQVVIANGDGSGTPTFSTPQDIHTAATPTFTGMDLSDANLTSVGEVQCDSVVADGAALTFGSTPSLVLTTGTTTALTLGNNAGDDFLVDATSLVVEGDTGRVGIGTASPATLFHVTTGSGNLEVRLESTHASGRCIFRMLADNGEDSLILFGDGDNTARGRLRYEHTDDSIDFRTAGTDNRLVIDSGGLLSIGGIAAGSAAAQLDIDQASTSGAIPVLRLDQADVSEPMIWFTGTASATNIVKSLVAPASVGSEADAGWIRIQVDDDGNQITDGPFYVKFVALTAA
jgi:hypothetical protein